MSGHSRYFSRPSTSGGSGYESRYLNPDDVLVKGSGSLADREHKSFFARMSPAGRTNYEQKYPKASTESYRGREYSSTAETGGRRVLLPSSSTSNYSDPRTERGRSRSSSQSSSTFRSLGLVEPIGASVSGHNARAGFDVWPDIRDSERRQNAIKRKPVPSPMPRETSDSSYLRQRKEPNSHRSRHSRPDPSSATDRYDDGWGGLRDSPVRRDARVVHQAITHPTGEKPVRCYAYTSDMRFPVHEDYYLRY